MGHRAKQPKRTFRPPAIRAWRELRGLTIEGLANQIDVSIATLSRTETGKQAYTQPLLEDIAKALKCEPADLVDRKPASGPTLELRAFIKTFTDEECRQAIRVLGALYPPRLTTAAE